MMLIPLLLALAAAPEKPAKPTAGQIAEAAPASSWGAIAAEDLLVMDFADGQRVVIWLAPDFAPVHVANIRKIARSGFWSTATIYRVQDNYVTQWGGGEDKAPPAGIVVQPPAEYEWVPKAAVRNPYKDAYAAVTGFTASGWAVAGDGKRQWLPHCYGAVGVARDLAPSVGTGADLYTVIGHAPRHLDRNIAVVGRVIDGMGALSARPRGTGGGLGLYEDPKQFIPIKRIAIASDLPAAEQPRFQYFKPSAKEFPKILEARANRGPPFFDVPSGAADLCNLPVPVRKVP
ncbi:peptidylprolyl isomerase [Sphingomonas immobilis]|uniref:peptidylprolyl isomerase n=1 Tax=Sphingomonas immobilis TaxID=3063997 RepID=A0ABT8ZZV4_9SPHN|nr:peptidylprolyl isomerase [Sphingomonas sp. CA1-15]MDO7843118.1 peptidylprolyl isomerase [Sphingomonas sp. CA1-15]